MFDTGLILAGGQGKRLRPLTAAIPKPLLPLGDKPIIHRIIEGMKAAGVRRIFVSVNYKQDMIRRYLGDGERFGLRIDYLDEEQPTGTAGCLALLDADVDRPMLISNGDLVADIDYAALFQCSEHFDLVITGIHKTVAIDFGVLSTNGADEITAWEEKPDLEYVISGGVYAVSPKLLAFVRAEFEPGGYLDMPTLWRAAKQHGLRTGLHLHRGYWRDVGKVEDYLELAETMD